MGTCPSLFATFLLIGFHSLEKGLYLALLYLVLYFVVSWKPVLFSNRKWRESGSVGCVENWEESREGKLCLICVPQGYKLFKVQK